MNTDYSDGPRLDWFTLLVLGPLGLLALGCAFCALMVGAEWLDHFLNGSLDQFNEWAASVRLGYSVPDFCQSVTGFTISAGLYWLFAWLHQVGGDQRSKRISPKHDP